VPCGHQFRHPAGMSGRQHRLRTEAYQDEDNRAKRP
jgi:hypothetical protein